MAHSFDPPTFASAFQEFLQRFHELLPERSDTLRQLVAEHLAADPSGIPALTEQLHSSDHPNLQLALDALLEEAPGWRLVGLPAELLHFAEFSLASMLGGRFRGPSEPCAPELVNIPIDVDRTLPCVRLGLYLLRFDDVPMAIMLGNAPNGPRPGLVVDVVAADPDAAGRFLARLRALMHDHNVYRGKTLSFAFSEWGGFGVTFHRLPTIERDDIVLPDEDLAAIERHAVGISDHAEVLRRSGRHLKRGLLLFGPPGTGKTLSVMYLCGRMPGRTTILLSGPGTHALGQAVAIARSLQPATVVLEDVDLVAMERTIPGMGTNPLLFQLLNEMDGLAEDADVLFVLTTNRVDLLEPALAARPGRVDQAVEIRLPDAACRRRLLDLYLNELDVSADELDDVVERSEGVTASFIKELARRAVLHAAMDGADATIGTLQVTAEDVRSALTDLLDHSAKVLRSSLGANLEAAAQAEQAVEGWVAFAQPAYDRFDEL